MFDHQNSWVNVQCYTPLNSNQLLVKQDVYAISLVAVASLWAMIVMNLHKNLRKSSQESSELTIIFHTEGLRRSYWSVDKICHKTIPVTVPLKILKYSGSSLSWYGNSQQCTYIKSYLHITRIYLMTNKFIIQWHFKNVWIAIIWHLSYYCYYS